MAFLVVKLLIQHSHRSQHIDWNLDHAYTQYLRPVHSILPLFKVIRLYVEGINDLDLCLEEKNIGRIFTADLPVNEKFHSRL